jgi:hypothetical protein
LIYSKPKLSCEIDIHQEVEKKTRLQTLERKRAVNEAKSNYPTKQRHSIQDRAAQKHPIKQKK